jgi:hypothetical protein
MTLRLVARFLKEALEERLQDLASKNPSFDVSALSARDLTPHKIQIVQAYKIVVRT